MPVHKLRLGYPSFRPGGRVEQPVLKLDLRRFGLRRIDAQHLPKLFHGSPVAEQPAAVFVWPIALGLPFRSRREQVGVVRHVELGGVLDAPPIRPVVAEQHAVGVDLLENLEVASGLDLQDRPAVRAEPLDLFARVGRRDVLGALPVLQLAAHERRVDRLGFPALLDDDRVELVAPVYRKYPVPILDAEQPLPPTVRKKQGPKRPCAVVRVDARRHEEPEPPLRTEQRVRLLQEELVEVEVGGPLVAVGMGGIGESRALGANTTPSIVKLPVGAALGNRETGLALLRFSRWIAKGVARVAHVVRLSPEPCVVVEPVALGGFVFEVALLSSQGLLLAVGPIERVDVGEELLGYRLRDVPRRVAEDGVEAGGSVVGDFPEDIGKLQLPVEEAHLGRDAPGDGPGGVGGKGELARRRCLIDFVGRPEPARGPEVHGVLQ